MKKLVIYVHGRGGSIDEAKYYRKFFDEDFDVIGIDYSSEFPWIAVKELQKYYDEKIKGYQDILLIASSIGAYFSMLAFSKKEIKKAFFISPIVDMENIILNMMKKSGVSEDELKKKEIVKTKDQEILSWEYLKYVKDNPINFDKTTSILYGEKDYLTPLNTIIDFSQKFEADLTVMPDGEHWFHTDEHMEFLDEWMMRLTD